MVRGHLASFYSLLCFRLLFHYVHRLLLLCRGLTTNFLYNKTNIHCCIRCILTEGERTKTTSDKIFQTKDPLTKSPGQKPPRTIEREFVQGIFVRVFCTRPTKNGGSEICNVLLGGSGMCDKV